jgi:hypothetical protein
MAARAFVHNAVGVSGSAESGAKMFGYVYDTVTPQTFYTDFDLTTPATNPFVADSAGHIRIYYDDALDWTFVVKSANEAATLLEVDVVEGVTVVTYATLPNFDSLNGELAQFVGPPGETGPTGPAGAQGPQGPQGPQGAAGDGSGDMLKSENLSGLANYTTARSNLGLAIGTNVQAWDAQLDDVSGLAVTDGGFIVGNGTNFVLETGATAQASLGYTASDVLTKLLTVDGAGSGLDADTLDGVQGSAVATLAGAQTFTGAKDFTGGLQLNGVNVVNLSATQTLTNKTLTSPTINGGTIQSRVIASTETTGTLTVASANETIQATGDITIPNAVFAAGDIILIYAGASSRTITQGSSVTMRLGGTATTGSRTLAARGVAMLFFVSSSEVVVSGGAVT